MEEYTGREIAIFTDIHGLLEPLEATLNDIKKRGIKEIYSLGDNIGSGPNPKEVLILLKNNHVKTLSGNREDYIIFGEESFSYLNKEEIDSSNWTKNKIGESGKEIIEIYPHSYELNVGGNKVGLCHFPNDPRFDYNDSNRTTWSYQKHFDSTRTGERLDNEASNQFKYTNSEEQFIEMQAQINKYGKNSPRTRGIMSAIKEPLFNGKSIFNFDDIFFGHVHWELEDKTNKTNFHSLRGLAIAYRNDPIDKAYYIILKEKKDNKGFDIEKVLVKYDREKMKESILKSTIEDNKIIKYASINN